MIVDCQVYVLHRGFVHVSEVSPGDTVYTLDNFQTKLTKVSEVESQFYTGKLNCVQSGMNQSLGTDTTRYQYVSPRLETRYLSFKEIPILTADKKYTDAYFYPALTWPAGGSRNISDEQIEYLVRTIRLHIVDYEKAFQLISNMSGSDAMVFVHFLEHWCSVSPGSGSFGRASVKARGFYLDMISKELFYEIIKTVLLAGYTVEITDFDLQSIKIYFVSTPTAGSIPKAEKYFPTTYYGNVYRVNAENKSILGIYKNRCFYLPFSDVQNYGILP